MTRTRERRALRTFGQQADVVELTADMVREILSCSCAWDGCSRTFRGQPPHGWRRIWDRGRLLCPKHAQQLDLLLKRQSSSC
jgi:hypothetical protein